MIPLLILYVRTTITVFASHFFGAFASSLSAGASALWLTGLNSKNCVHYWVRCTDGCLWLGRKNNVASLSFPFERTGVMTKRKSYCYSISDRSILSTPYQSVFALSRHLCNTRPFKKRRFIATVAQLWESSACSCVGGCCCSYVPAHQRPHEHHEQLSKS